MAEDVVDPVAVVDEPELASKGQIAALHWD